MEHLSRLTLDWMTRQKFCDLFVLSIDLQAYIELTVLKESLSPYVTDASQ